MPFAVAALAAGAFASAPPVRGIELRVASSGELVLYVTRRARSMWSSLAGGRWSIECQSIGPPFSDQPSIRRDADGVVAPARTQVRTGLFPRPTHLDLFSGSVSAGDASH